MSLRRIGLSVTDLEGQSRWYQRHFGLVPAGSIELDAYALRAEILRSPDSGWELELQCRAGATGGIRADHPLDTALTLGYGFIALEVDDIVAACAAVAAAGGRELMGPHPRPDGWAAFVTDPEGNLLQLSSTADGGPAHPAPPRQEA